MPTNRFPKVDSNLPPESVRWGVTVEQVINELLARIAALETRG